MAAQQLATERKTEPQWTPRFCAYAKAHGRTPVDMMHEDAAQWPGGVMTGFTLWISWAWRTWDAIHVYGPNHVRTDEEHDQFTLWLLNTLGLAS